MLNFYEVLLGVGSDPGHLVPDEGDSTHVVVEVYLRGKIRQSTHEIELPFDEPGIISRFFLMMKS
jgi:hypothetical protein